MKGAARRVWMAVVMAGVVAVGWVPVARASAAADVTLTGAGATFPQPLYERWIREYQKVEPGVKIDYRATGSGAGIKAITDKTVHFAGSDSPLTRKEQEAMGGATAVAEFPSCAGGVVPAFNLEGIKELNLTGEVIARIFLGTVNKWNDAAIAELNPGVKLPEMAITPVWRTDGSGTTFVMTNYLATQSAEFKRGIGMGKSVKWPVGQGGKGNPGVAAVVQQTPGALGYMEQNFASQNGIAYAAVKNAAGEYVKASPASIAKATEAAVGEMKAPLMSADIWNSSTAGAYPIASFTYLIVYADLANLENAAQAEALKKFLLWTVEGGQKLAVEEEYAPLSEAVRAKVVEAVKGLTFKGAELSGAASAGGAK